MWGPVVCCSPSPLSTRFWHIPSPPKDEFLLRRDQIGKSFFSSILYKMAEAWLGIQNFHTRCTQPSLLLFFIWCWLCFGVSWRKSFAQAKTTAANGKKPPETWNRERSLRLSDLSGGLLRLPRPSLAFLLVLLCQPLTPFFLVDWKQPSDCTFRKRFCQTMDDLPRGGPPPPETLSCACAANFARFLKDIV